MENQHRKISGYKELDEDQIQKMNEVKHLAQQVGELIDSLAEDYENPGQQARWLNIGRTQLQQGFMAVTRSIANPDFF